MEDKNNLQEEILGYIENSNSPVTVDSICSDLSLAKYVAERVVGELLIGNKIQKVMPQNSSAQKREYFTDVKRVINYEECQNQEPSEIIQKSVNIQEGYKELEEKVEILDQNVTGIYTNIISIMSIFVAIFALITVNANITFELAQGNLKNVFIGIIAMNIFVVACIIALLWGVKRIIIDPMTKKKNEK